MYHPSMNDPKEIVEKLLNTVQLALPESLAEDVKGNVLAVVKSSLSELDVVSREELEIQTAVLQKTRMKLEVLEAKLTELEEKIQ